MNGRAEIEIVLPVCVSDGKEGDDVSDGEHPGVESQDVVQGSLERDVVEYLVTKLIGICLRFLNDVKVVKQQMLALTKKRLRCWCKNGSRSSSPGNTSFSSHSPRTMEPPS